MLSNALQRLVERSRDDKSIVGVRVGHGYYGCESGCCGSEIQVVDSEGDELDHAEFAFNHDYASRLDEAKEVATTLELPLFDNEELRKKVENCW